MQRGSFFLDLVRGNISKDHVHLLVSSTPSFAPAKVVQFLKGRSSRLLRDEFVVLKRRYWGQHLCGGYFCGTVGAVTEEMIKADVENQSGEEEQEQQFKITE